MSNSRRPPASWTTTDIPPLAGRTAVVTGANSGVGREVARALAHRGASVLLACRDREAAAATSAEIGADVETRSSGGSAVAVHLDLADLASVRGAARRIHASTDRVDILVNNAAVMAPPRATTFDGFELQFGTNHLGHFALTGLLLDLLLPAPAARITTVSSRSHASGTLAHLGRSTGDAYDPYRAYGDSKLANLLFAYELQRRLAATAQSARSTAAHPGGVRTNLQRHNRIRDLIARNRLISFPLSSLMSEPEEGALMVLRAATDPDLPGGTFIGPDGPRENKGHPVVVESSPLSHDRDLAERLWARSVELTAVEWPLLAAAESAR